MAQGWEDDDFWHFINSREPSALASYMAAYLDKIDQNEFRKKKKDFNMLEYSLPYRVLAICRVMR
jgi:hypothetical protein